MKKAIGILILLILGGVSNAASSYEYKRELREGAIGKWVNLRQHLNSGQRLKKELTKVDKKVSEIQEKEELLFRIEEYKAENGIR